MGIVQYIVIRKDLAERFDQGFVACQVAHASLAPISEQLRAGLDKLVCDSLELESLEWIKRVFTKILLEVPNLEGLVRLIEDLDKNQIKYSTIRESKIQDELTCIGLRPYEKSRVEKYFKGLKLYKGDRK